MKIEFPAWVPYPRSWLQAMLPTIVFPLIWSIPGEIIENAENRRWMVQLAIELMPLLVWLPIQVVIYLHHWLFGKGHPMRPGVQSFWEGIYAFQVFIDLDMARNIHDTEDFVWFGITLCSLFFIIAVYLYQLEHLVRHPKSDKLHSAKRVKASSR